MAAPLPPHSERQLAVEKLRCKYETLVLKGRGQEGEGEGLQSQAYYIVKAAQERQELAEQAEGLVAAVAQAERESRALEATLQVSGWCGAVAGQDDRGLVGRCTSPLMRSPPLTVL